MGLASAARRLRSWSAVACLMLSGTSFAQTARSPLSVHVSPHDAAAGNACPRVPQNVHRRGGRTS